jgi:hypothetical protein
VCGSPTNLTEEESPNLIELAIEQEEEVEEKKKKKKKSQQLQKTQSL